MTAAELQALRDADVEAGSPRCRGCGCTDHVACDPPCWWEDDDVCSSCVGAVISA